MVRKAPAPSSIQTTTYWKSAVVSVSMNWAMGGGSRRRDSSARRSRGPGIPPARTGRYFEMVKLRLPTVWPSTSTSTL